MSSKTMAVALACVLSVAACSSGGSTPAPTRPSSASGAERVVSAQTARAALLSQQDVGAALKQGTYHPPSSPLYCAIAGAPTLAKATSASGVVGVAYASVKPQATLVEDVYLFTSRAAAAAALGAMQNDMACVTGHDYSSGGMGALISVGPGVDYASRVSSVASAAYGWTLRNSTQGGMQFALTVGTTLILIKYLLATKALSTKHATSAFPDALSMARLALDHASAF